MADSSSNTEELNQQQLAANHGHVTTVQVHPYPAHLLALEESTNSPTGTSTIERAHSLNGRNPRRRSGDYYKHGKKRHSLEMLKHRRVAEAAAAGVPAADSVDDALDYAPSVSTCTSDSDDTASSTMTSVFLPNQTIASNNSSLGVRPIGEEEVSPGNVDGFLAGDHQKDYNNNSNTAERPPEGNDQLAAVIAQCAEQITTQRQASLDRYASLRSRTSNAASSQGSDYPEFAQIHRPRYVQYNHTRRRLSFVKCDDSTTPEMDTNSNSASTTQDNAGSIGRNLSRLIRSDDDRFGVSLHSGKIRFNSASDYKDADMQQENLFSAQSDSSSGTGCECCKCCTGRCEHFKRVELFPLSSERFKRKVLNAVTLLCFFGVVWLLGVIYVGQLFTPGGWVFGIIILYLTAYVVHRIFILTFIPSYVGTLAVGMLFNNVSAISAFLSIDQNTSILIGVGLCSIVVLREGVRVDGGQLRAAPRWLIPRLALLPPLVEAVAVMFIALVVWRHSIQAALIYSICVCVAGSGVTYREYYHLKHNHLGMTSHIPTIMTSSANINNVLGIVLYAALVGVFLTSRAAAWFLLYCVVAGAGSGLVAGLVLWFLPSRIYKYSLTYQVLLTALVGCTAVGAALRLVLPGAGVLAVVTMCAVAAVGWRRQGVNFEIVLENKLSWLDGGLSPLLFAIIGYQVVFSSGFSSLISKAVISLVLVLVIRAVSVYNCLLFTSLPKGERIYIVMHQCIKSTLTLTLSVLTLWTLLFASPVNYSLLQEAGEIFAATLFQVLVTTLVGQLLLRVSAKHLLCSGIAGGVYVSDEDGASPSLYGATPYTLSSSAPVGASWSPHQHCRHGSPLVDPHHARAHCIVEYSDTGEPRTHAPPDQRHRPVSPLTADQQDHQDYRPQGTVINLRRDDGSNGATPSGRSALEDIQSDPDETFL